MSDRRDWGTEAKRVRIRLLEGERPKLVSPNKEEHNLVEVIISVDKVIEERRHETKHAGTLQAKVAVQKTLKAAEARRSKKRQELYNAQDAIDARRDEFIEGIERQLEQGYKLDTLFTVRWSVD